MPGRSTGFTIVEFVVVALVVAILAVVAVPGVSSSDDQKLQLAAREVASALRFARSEALRTAVPHGVRVTDGGQRVRVFRLDTDTVPPTERFEVRHPMDKRLYDIDLAGGVFTAGVEASASFRYLGGGPPEQAVSFDGRGEPVAPSDLAPLESGTVSISDGVATRTVNVVSMVGRVTLQ